MRMEWTGMNDKKYFRPVRILGIIAAIIIAVALFLTGMVITRERRAAGTESAGFSLMEFLSGLFTEKEEDAAPAADNTEAEPVVDTEPVPAREENQMTEEELKKAEEERFNAPNVIIDGITAITATAGDHVIRNINLTNDAENADYYYMTYELRLPKDGGEEYEVLFSTGLIDPGKTIMDVTMTRALEAGEYDCRLLIQPYRMADNSKTNSTELQLIMTVK